ncbi:5-formyltetrahydrofolate cyclo-ligase [Parasporobacterium paucivorans]|uniref:5-formyltetrahydrofolate cyclo-ligase n=1 Tax=Parasporobacterium paucivorans DSM 15970 TaxID=1122934 RepID=A0A1M6IBI4_9FIRM|nr:5-formyltetrahydrofolate cyclo-ligase [Parasporobacterium paucivorans]SHJ31767.1 5-formyltetrahydrofolate cyclo-ligase [Parasporobacterium paucivorans DSM 15970]
MDKKELRVKLLVKRENISDREIEERSRGILGKLKEMDEFKRARTVMIYVSFGKEIRTWEFIQECLALGKEVITPICNNKDGTLILGKTPEFPEGFKQTKFGILELPACNCNHADIEDIDFIVMPGLAFSKEGGRLGYGAGYYDKLLEHKSEKTVTVAPSFEEFVLENLPIEPHDVRMDYVVTDSKIYKSSDYLPKE